jgi:hypothetical protein
MFRVALVAMAALLTLPATAHAGWRLAEDGHPLIYAHWYPNPEVSVCPPGEAACTPVSLERGEYWPGATAVGTTFEVRWDGGVERSPAWQGQVRRTGPLPSLTGALYATGSATAVGTAWTGGWGDEVSRFDIVACSDAAGTDCVPLPPPAACPQPCVTPASNNRYDSFAGVSVALPVVVAGRHLFVVERREARDTRGLDYPAAFSSWQWPMPSFDLWPGASSVVAVSPPVGPLATPAPAADDRVSPVPPPTVTLRSKALKTKGRISLGRVVCSKATCDVALRVSGGGKRDHLARFTVEKGLTAITVPRRRGKLVVRVRVDGKLLARGRVTAR